jgi:hypothetical protein
LAMTDPLDPPSGKAPPRDFDLTKIEPATPPVTGQNTKPGFTAYDPSPHREEKRGQIALLLVGTLVGIVAGAFAIFVVFDILLAIWPSAKLSFDHVKAVVEMLLTPMVGLVGAVAGFYFGEKKN